MADNTVIGRLTTNSIVYDVLSDGRFVNSSGECFGYVTENPDGSWGVYNRYDRHLKDVTSQGGTRNNIDFTNTGDTQTGTPAAPSPQTNPSQNTNRVVGIMTLDGVGYTLYDDGKIYEPGGNCIAYAVTDVNGGYNIYTPEGQYYSNISPQGVVTNADGTISDSNVYFDIHDQPNYVADITMTNPDGSVEVYRLGNNGQVYDDNNNVIATYQTSADGRTYNIVNLDGTPHSTLDAATGTLSYPGGGSETARFTPLQHNVPMYGGDTSTTQSTLNKTDTTDTRTSEQMQRGIDWSSPVAAALKAGIITEAQALPELARQAGVQAQEKYVNLMSGIGLPQYQGELNTLAGRNVLSSSVAGSSLANVQQQMNQAIANKAFEASLAGTQAEMQVPNQLSNIIASLGGQAGTTAGTTTGRTSQQGTQTRTTEGFDPLAPYRLMGQLSYQG